MENAHRLLKKKRKSDIGMIVERKYLPFSVRLPDSIGGLFCRFRHIKLEHGSSKTAQKAIPSVLTVEPHFSGVRFRACGIPIRGALLESPETLRVLVGCHNSLCISKTETI